MNVFLSVLMILFLCLGFTNSVEAWSPLIDTIWTIKEDGGRVDWLHSGNNLIAFDKPDLGDYYDVFTMNPDGSNEVCLTCDNPQLPGKHMGNPAWHPSGNYIVFQAEKSHHPGGSDWSKPGLGRWNDLWLMTSDGDSVWQLTNLDTSHITGLLHSQFSHDGSKLLWAEQLEIGEWALRVADFVDRTNNPHLDSIVTYQPGDQHIFYESHGWSKDDSMVIFCGSLQPDQHWTGIDIYWFNIYTQELFPLTSTMVEWDEHAHPHPDGNNIVWMSSKGYDFNPNTLDDLRCDYWLMNADGSNKMRLTYFNEPGHPEYTGEQIVAGDNSWSLNGTKLIAYLVYTLSAGRVVMIEFAEPSIEEGKISHPESFYLSQNYPNPFRGETVISYQLSVIGENPEPITDYLSPITISIYDLSGRLIRTLSFPSSPISSRCSVVWDGKNDLGENVASGIYFCKLEVGDKFSQTKKLLLLR